MRRYARAGLVAALGLSLARGIASVPTTAHQVSAATPTSRVVFLPQITNTGITSQRWTDAELDALDAINRQRRAAGCAPLASNAELYTAARLHSEDMARNNYVSHQSLDGRSFVDRARAAGYRYRPSGETIAAGYESGAAVVDGWMNSSGHRDILMDCANDDIGIGLAINPGSKYGSYWTAVLGQR